MEKALQLYLIGGFLGSGKTTFLRNMLENMTDRKIGVLVNEFGDISIDGTVIRTPVSSISVLGRNTQGVRLMRVADDSKVMCVARAEAEPEEIEEAEAPETNEEV